MADALSGQTTSMTTKSQTVAALRSRSRGSLLTVPALFVAGALILSAVTVAADALLHDVIGAEMFFRGDIDSARSILSSIAASTITLTGLVFSVTMLVLQLTSAQYSPRATGALLTDRNSKLTLGVFVGTFTYCVAVLRTVGAGDEGLEQTVSVGVAVVLALVTIAFFIQYVNHVAQQIQPSSIIRRVAAGTQRAIKAHLSGEASPSPTLPPTGAPDQVVGAPKPGAVRSIDDQGLLERATEEDLQVEVVAGVGEFVAEGAPLMRVWGDAADDDPLTRYVEMGDERSLDDDPLYGFRQLVDIADRALSPGTNDPTTAVQAIDHLHDLLRRIVDRDLPNGVHADDDGRPRLFVHEPSWQEFLDLSVDEVVLYGANSLQVRKRVGAMLDDLASVAPPDRMLSIHQKLASAEETFA